MFLGFLDFYTVLIVLHVFGVIMGAGGAYASDFMFFSSIKDRHLSQTEMRFLGIASRMVWSGIAILVISGAALFSLNPQAYLASGAFLAKMTIVGVIIVNGILFHLIHIPRLKKQAETGLPFSDDFIQKSSPLLLRGAVSSLSWTSAFVLGALLREIPYNYGVILLVYVFLLGGAMSTALLLKKRIFFSKGQEDS